MYTLYVYPGISHWYKPIEELTETFSTIEEAEETMRLIAKFRPQYTFEIIKEK